MYLKDKTTKHIIYVLFKYISKNEWTYSYLLEYFYYMSYFTLQTAMGLLIFIEKLISRNIKRPGAHATAISPSLNNECKEQPSSTKGLLCQKQTRAQPIPCVCWGRSYKYANVILRLACHCNNTENRPWTDLKPFPVDVGPERIILMCT